MMLNILLFLFSPVNLVLFAVAVIYLVLVFKEAKLLKEPRVLLPRLGLLTTDEKKIRKLARLIDVDERFTDQDKPVEEVLKSVIDRNMILILILGEKMSGMTAEFVAHLQNARASGQSSSVLNLRYAVFGVGDSSLDDFNRLALDVDLILRQLGAKSQTPMHLFDDVVNSTGLHGEFKEFYAKFSPRNILDARRNAALNLPAEENSDEEDKDSDEQKSEAVLVDVNPDGFVFEEQGLDREPSHQNNSFGAPSSSSATSSASPEEHQKIRSHFKIHLDLSEKDAEANKPDEEWEVMDMPGNDDPICSS